MRVRDWEDIVEDVVSEDVDPDGWRAVAGDRESGVGEDLYLGHPGVGVYLLKTYAKNPFEVRGVGSRVARKVDDDLDPLFPDREEGGRFAVQSPPDDEEEAETAVNRLKAVLETHADAPTTPGDLFDDAMDALDSPAFGPMEYDTYDRPEALSELDERFEEPTELLDAELDDLVEADDVGRGFQ